MMAENGQISELRPRQPLLVLSAIMGSAILIATGIIATLATFSVDLPGV